MRPLIIGELAVVALLLVVYDRVRGVAHVHRAAAVAHGWAIIHLETALHLGVESTVNQWLAGHTLLGRIAVDYYQYLHVTVALCLLVACYVFRPSVYRPARNALLIVNAVGLAIYLLYPVAPPRLLPGTTFLDLVARAGFGPTHGGPIPINEYGAMPSLHLAWAAWAALVGFAITEVLWIRGLVVVHVFLTAFVVVGTANHYLLDVVMGVALAGFAGGSALLLRTGTIAGRSRSATSTEALADAGIDVERCEGECEVGDPDASEYPPAKDIRCPVHAEVDARHADEEHDQRRSGPGQQGHEAGAANDGDHAGEREVGRCDLGRMAGRER